MPFDMGFDFRATSGFVTDDATWGVPVLGETSPTTYTNGASQSVQGSWGGGLNTGDRVNTNDARLAGCNSCVNIPSITRTFTIDLSTGSAPGPGTYLVDIALGDASNAQKHFLKLFDNATLKLDLTNGGSGYTTAAGHFRDATGTDIAATTNWTGAPVEVTFATNTVKITLNPDGFDDGFASQTSLAHVRLTLQAGGTAYTLAADTGAFTLNLNPVQPVANVRTTTFALTGFPAALRWSAAGGGLTAYHHHYGG